MKHYLIKESDQLKIMQVAPELEESFLQRYAGKIITSSWSIQGVIERYSALLNFMACNGSQH
jgi:hypothetical protein